MLTDILFAKHSGSITSTYDYINQNILTRVEHTGNTLMLHFNHHIVTVTYTHSIDEQLLARL